MSQNSELWESLNISQVNRLHQPDKVGMGAFFLLRLSIVIELEQGSAEVPRPLGIFRSILPEHFNFTSSLKLRGKNKQTSFRIY